MIISRLLLDGAVFNKTLKTRTIKRLQTGVKWLIKINHYRILVERNDAKNYDVTVYDDTINAYKHFIIWKHCFRRYCERTVYKTEEDRFLHILKQLLLEDYTISKVTNVHYYNSDNKDIYNVFAYDMTEDGILIYKTFFKRAKNISA